MTQAFFVPTIDVRLISMNPPTAIATGLALAGSEAEQSPSDLLLYPDEFCELVLRLENQSGQSLQLTLAVIGEFPGHWCLWEATTAIDLAPQQIEEVRIGFKANSDFFERPQALTPTQPQLPLNFPSQLEIYETDYQSLIACRSFSLFVRPRSFYLNFLPAFYQEMDFMQRLVSLFEQAFDPYVQTIDTLWASLDPLTAPESLLPFLSHWVAWNLKPTWSLEQQRQLIRHALTLYRWHGTRYGLRFYLHLYTGLPLDEELPETQKAIGIEEVFEGGFQFGNCAFGQDAMMGGGKPYHFTVRLRPSAATVLDAAIIRQIIEQQKPAFCTYDLAIEENDPRS
jgi:phage tail-like protein